MNLFAIGDGRVLFRARDIDHGIEMWVTDGTSEGTTLLNDIYPGPSSSMHPSPSNWDMAQLPDGRVLFTANDGVHGQELWVTDGTEAGTMMLKDINPGEAWSQPSFSYWALVGREVLFTAVDGTHGNEPWITDGTAEGTRLLKDINPGDANSFISFITGIGGGRALFTATDGTHGRELWSTDGTEAGTVLLRDIFPGGSSMPSHPVPLGDGRAVFTATDETEARHRGSPTAPPTAPSSFRKKRASVVQASST